MNTTREPVAPQRPASIRRPLSRCPECGSADLEPIVALEAEEVNFLCGSCGRCWHVELGYVSRVRPTTCEGCMQQRRCLALYEADHTSR